MFADSSADVNRLVKAKLLWQAPGNVSGSVFKGYTVRYRPVDSPVDSWEQLTVQHTEVTVSDLSKFFDFLAPIRKESLLFCF